MFGDARDREDYKGNRSTMPARVRPGKAYPGGRSLRRAKKILQARQTAFNGKSGFTMPGALKM